MTKEAREILSADANTEQEMQKPTREHAHEARREKASVPAEYEMLACEFDPKISPITYPAELSPEADPASKWDHEVQMEKAFTRVQLLIGQAPRQIAHIFENAPEKEKVYNDALKLTQDFEKNIAAQSVRGYFGRLTDDELYGGPLEAVAPKTKPEMRAINIAETVNLRGGNVVTPTEHLQPVDSGAETHLITVATDETRAISSAEVARITGNSGTQIHGFTAPGSVEEGGVKNKIEQIGGTYKMQVEVIEKGKKVLEEIADYIRNAGRYETEREERKAA